MSRFQLHLFTVLFLAFTAVVLAFAVDILSGSWSGSRAVSSLESITRVVDR